MKALQFNFTLPQAGMIYILRTFSKKFCYRRPFATIRLADIPEPKLPSTSWVKIKLKYCGFCGSDLNLILLRESPMAMPFTSFPCVPGHEICGEIVEAGSDVRHVKVNDTVTIEPILNCDPREIKPVCQSCSRGMIAACENTAKGRFAPGMFTGICRDINGGFAEYMVAHKSQVFRMPKNVSPESAVLTEPLAVAIQAVLDNRPDRRDKVLVIGGGVIGAMVVKAIRGLGISCSITVTEPSPFHSEYLKKSGADAVIQGSIIKAAETITGGKAYKPVIGRKILMGGFNRVFDTVGISRTVKNAFSVTAGGGTVSLIGISNYLMFDPTPIWLKLLTIRGCYGHGYNTVDGGKKRHAFEIALDMLSKKKIHVEDMLTHTFPLEEYRKMIDVNLDKARSGAIKTAVHFAP